MLQKNLDLIQKICQQYKDDYKSLQIDKNYPGVEPASDEVLEEQFVYSIAMYLLDSADARHILENN